MSVAVQMTADFDTITAFSEAVGLIYEARLDHSRIGDASRAIGRLLGADDVTITCASGESGPEYQRRTNGRMLCLDIPGHDGGGARLLVLRDAGRPPFTDSDVVLLSQLRPHLHRAEWLGVLLPQGALGTLAGETFVRLMNKGLIVADVDGVVRWQNPAAKAILGRADGISVVDGRLRAGRAFETATLLELLRACAEGHRRVMLVRRGIGKHPIGVAVTRVESPSAASAGGRPLLLVSMKEIEREIETLGGRIGDLFGLTAAEEQLAVLLLNGHSLQSAADEAQKTLATVKSQLHSLLKKTGARGQAELMNVLLSLPSLI